MYRTKAAFEPHPKGPLNKNKNRKIKLIKILNRHTSLTSANVAPYLALSSIAMPLGIKQVTVIMVSADDGPTSQKSYVNSFGMGTIFALYNYSASKICSLHFYNNHMKPFRSC